MEMHVSKWRTVLAVTVGAAMLATSAITQSGAGSPPASHSAAAIKAMQQALKNRGHDPGEVDGTMGPRTQAALRDYQLKEGLKATGVADAETMAKLAASNAAPSPSGESSTITSKDETSSGVTESR